MAAWGTEARSLGLSAAGLERILARRHPATLLQVVGGCTVHGIRRGHQPKRRA